MFYVFASFWRMILQWQHLDLLDLVPLRCSCRGTQRQLGYGSSPGVSVLGRWIASCTVRPMSAQLLLTTSSHLFFGRPRPRWLYTYPSNASLDSDLVPFCSRGQSIEVVVAESDYGYLGSASICRRCLRFWCSLFLSLPQSSADTTSQRPWVGFGFRTVAAPTLANISEVQATTSTSSSAILT